MLTAGIVTASVALFVILAANFGCWLLFRLWPRLLISENERLSLDYFARFDGELRPYISQWFGIDPSDWGAMRQEVTEHLLTANRYEDFTGFRPVPCAGRFVNFSEDGYRSIGAEAQGPWPISKAFYNVFFFGGSTTLSVGPDWTAIPRYLQDALDSRRIEGRQVRVYNFGRGAYFSTQEKHLFQQLLLDGCVPNAAIFLDGVNEFYFFEGRTAVAGLFDHSLSEITERNRDARLLKLAARPKWASLKEFYASLPLSHMVEILGHERPINAADNQGHLYRPGLVGDEVITQVIERYLANKRQIEALALDYGVAPVFVWQPSPAYKYDLARHLALNLHYGLGGHGRSGPGYAAMAERLKTQPQGTSFIWLADIQEHEREPIYVDTVHYTGAFSKTVAGHIAKALDERGLLPSNVDQPLCDAGSE